MPGICGLISLDPHTPTGDLDAALGALAYGRATVVERGAGSQLELGCAHLGTGGQRALYASSQAVVLFYGYLTRPAIPPGADESDPAASARYIHDLYLARGKAFLTDLQGAFAFALWDERTETMMLATDRLGMRPIYYGEHDNVLRFASEVKGLLADPAFPRRLDQAAASEFFHFRYVLGDKTFFENIRLLPPASYLYCQDGAWRIVRYWEPSYPDKAPRRSNQWYDQHIYDTLKAAVERMVRPQLRYGISLSSGMDSRWIAAILSEIKTDTVGQAFTFGGPVSSASQVDVAGQVASLAGLKHHRLSLSSDFMAEHAERMVYISDGMHSFVDAQEFPLILEIGNHVDVAVGGFMGSGFFGQNPIYHYVRAKDVFNLRKRYSHSYMLPRTVMERIFGAAKYKELESVADQGLRAAIDEAPSQRGFQIYNYEAIRQRQRRFTFYAQLFKTPYVDMYHPIADNEVWDLCIQFPPSQLVYKRALRRALGAYYPQLAALPWNNAPGSATVSVPSILAREVYSRAKRRARRALGIVRAAPPTANYLDYANWLKGPLRPFVEETLLSSEANATGLFDAQGLRDVVQGHIDGHQDATAFLGLALPFALWTRMFFVPPTPIRPEIMVQKRIDQ